MWDLRRVVGLVLLLFYCYGLDARGDKYARTSSYRNEVVVRCARKNSPMVKILRDYSDVMNYGPESVDLRMRRKTFARVQSYFPDCSIVVQNLEVAVQEAEAQMFPKMSREQEAWMQTVVQSVYPESDSEQLHREQLTWSQEMQNSRAWFEQYHNYEDTINWYKNLANRYNNLIVYKDSIGKTKEGRDMPCLHITASRNSDRKRFYIQCQIHAREWISGAFCMYLAQRLVMEYSDVQSVKDLLDNIEIVLVPFVNPDGYVYTWQHDRMWRKNRNKHSGSTCFGVDINRNFPDGFEPKASSCAEDYGGPSAKSELETQHIMANFRRNKRIVGSLDVHSYGQLILRPYGKTDQSCPDEALHAKIGSEMAKIIKKKHGSTYTSEKSNDLYPCYGIVADWLYSDDASKTNGGYRSASLCVELRSNNATIGFLLPANQILPTAEEVYPAILYYVKEMLANPIEYKSNSRYNSYSSSQFEDENDY